MLMRQRFAHLAFRQRGVLLIEVLVTIVIVSFGLLGIGALFMKSQQFGDEAYTRYQALRIAQDMAERIASNMKAAESGATSAYVTGASGSLPGAASFSPSYCSGSSSGGNCTDASARALDDLAYFNEVLTGSYKTYGVSADKVAELDGALGCVEFVGEAGNVANPARYRVSVAWQGREDNSDPVLPAGATLASVCGAGSYATGAMRLVFLETMPLEILQETPP